MADEQSQMGDRRLLAATEINSRLLGGTPTDDLLLQIAEQARQFSTSDRVLILLTDPANGGRLLVRAATGGPGEQLIGSIVEPVIVGATPALVPDLAELLPGALGGGYGPALAVPIGWAKGIGGVLLALRDKGGSPYMPEQISVLAAFADQAALAERDRIAGDLHDRVIQRLFATGMSLQSGVQRITDAEARSRVLRVVEQLDETVREIRTLIFGPDADQP